LKEQIKKILPRNQFARSVSILAGGTAAGQAVVVLASPLLTRLYSPEDFGLLAVYASLLALILVVASLRYELAIPLPEDDGQAANIVALCLLIVLCTSLVTAVAVLFFREPITNALGVPTLASYMWLLPIGVMLGGVYSVFNYWAVRTKSFTAIASTKLRQALATIAIQLAAFRLGGIALLFGQIAGQSVGTASLARPAFAMSAFKEVSWQKIIVLAEQYRRFPIFSTWSGIFGTVGIQLPPLVLATVFGSPAAGYYIVAHRVLGLPSSLIAGAVSPIFFGHGARCNQEHEIAELVRKTYEKLSVIALPPAILVFLFAPYLFGIIFGNQWADSGVLARWLIPWLFMAFITSPLTPVSAIMGREKESMWWHSAVLIARVIALSYGIIVDSLIATVVAYSFVSAFGYIVRLLWIFHHTGNRLMSLFLSTSKALIIAISSTFPSTIVYFTAQENVKLIMSSLVISLLLIVFFYCRLFREVY